MPFPLSQVTRDAIGHHFRRKKLMWEEFYFLKVLQTSANKHDIYWAVLALRDCGTAASLPALKAKLTYPMKDVKCCAILTIAHIAGAEETLFYANTLLNREYRDKGYALWAIRDAADNRAVDAVLEYFKRNRSKLKSGKLSNGTLAKGLEYLEKYREGRDEVHSFFSEVQGFWENLPEGERVEIAKRVKFFSAP